MALSLMACQSQSPAPEGGIGDGLQPPPNAPFTAQLIRRLNRTEYLNTVRELLGPTASTSQVLPADDQVGGYDNNAQVLSLSPLLLEKYALAAEELVASALAPTNSQGRARLLTCDFSGANEEPCAKQILARFGSQAWRRPLSAEDVSALLARVKASRTAGDTFEVALGVGLQSILVSPHFLFRVELDPSPDALEPHPLNDFELATRLSYFLWSGPPDEALLAAAAAGTLKQEAELEQQVRRMLADPRAQALVDNFAGQWLRTRQLALAQPSPSQFPTYASGQLAQAMAMETALVFRELLQSDRSVLDLVDADFTYVNAALATHYGLPGSFDPDPTRFTRVTLSPQSSRRGILTHGSILTLNATPTRNSTVKRGKWVLGRLLCQEPPPPPANVPQLPSSSPTAGSLRQRMEQHVSDPACSGCHQKMDPIGFALEHYDAIGAWRATDGQYTIDARGTFPDGRTFDGALEMATVLKNDPDLPSCVVRHVFTYAMGRTPEWSDELAIAQLTQTFQARGHRMKELLVQVVLSPPFRMRRAQEAQP
ncbi:DUF1592 domain-containing protein [Hyalangium rubrum]|uniref:DUF1592 domain-containing protein n=1 Tax=Hyalangium rubrum TaxID=3103134 RepID=A0ABU5H4J2_9BACT|nr:DUF1592 domain-containing protein [Hyalangium sp. s54d21]MDY7227994.1 DUF1592 domain-containing protein [Hyalangium sp. s54d21]